MIQLQVNTAGAWRNVLSFERSDRHRVIQAIAILSSVAPRASWCLVHANGEREWISGRLVVTKGGAKQ